MASDTTTSKALEIAQEYEKATRKSSNTVVNPKTSNFAKTIGLTGLKSVLGVN